MNNGTQQEKRRWPDPGNGLVILYVGVMLILVVLAMVADGYGQELQNSTVEIGPESVRRGELLFTGGPEKGQYLPAPHLSLDVEMYVTGMTARTIVHQRFANDSDQWQEAIYVFPLPDESAVDRMRMKIGTRVIEGVIKEKQEARKIYAEAKTQGKKASLLSQERPNIFTVALANIAPGEEIGVEIEFQQVVAYRDGIFSLRFPLVVGPRYIPGTPLGRSGEQGELAFSGRGWSFDSDQVADASRITPPVAMEQEQLNPVRLMVELAAGFPLSRVDSLYHGITMEEGEENVQVIRFNGRVMADRDFVLEWEAVKGRGPQAALFAESQGEDDYLLLMLTPPAVAAARKEALPRELIFVLDTSGSMAGPSIVQAKQALVLAISRLGERDRFNVIEFNSKARMLFNHSRVADLSHREQAISFVNSLSADGGTEIGSALKLALDKRVDHQRIRQVIFLTDGSVGNESQLLSLITDRLGDSRLFTVGIGSAPNSYFMSRAATMGRGSFTHIGKSSEVQERMVALFEKLEYPAITDLSVKTASGQVLELYPDPIPDLYHGEPLLVSMRLPEKTGNFLVSGRRGSEIWQQELSSAKLAGRPGIAALWARKKIRAHMDSLAFGADEEEVREQVLATALQHHLLSRYTSLVAIEKRVSRPGEKDMQKSNLKSNLPAGWQMDKIFGGTARTATPAALETVLGLLLLLSALLLLSWKRRGI